MTPFPREAYRHLSPYAPDRRPVEVDLSDNTSRWGVHPAALAAVRAADPEELLRYPPVYADRLREAVSRQFGVPEACVSTGCGSDDLLDSAFRAAGDPGEGVRYLPPTFSMVEIFARMNAMEPRPIARQGPAGEEAFGAFPSPDQWLQDDPALIYLCRPNNPTGESADRKAVERLLAAAGAEGPMILIDEAYAEFGGDHFLQEAVSHGRLLVLRTLSKVYGLAGLRVGFAVGSPAVVAEVEKARGPYKVNRLAEAAAVAALDDAEGWAAERVQDAVASRRELASELGRRRLAPLPSQANFLLIPLSDTPLATAGAGAVTAALRERGVAVRPFPALPGIGDALRVSVGPPAEIARFLRELDHVLAHSK